MHDAFDPEAEHSTVGPPASVEDELDQADETVAVDELTTPDATPTDGDGDPTETPPSPDVI